MANSIINSSNVLSVLNKKLKIWRGMYVAITALTLILLGFFILTLCQPRVAVRALSVNAKGQVIHSGWLPLQKEDLKIKKLEK